MFQYIKRNILRRGDSPNNDFCFLADQLLCTIVSVIDDLLVTVDRNTLYISSIRYYLVHKNAATAFIFRLNLIFGS